MTEQERAEARINLEEIKSVISRSETLFVARSVSGKGIAISKETFLALVEDNFNSLDREEQLIAALKEILRVTADGSIPDEWNGSTGGSGHAECRRIANRALNQS